MNFKIDMKKFDEAMDEIELGIANVYWSIIAQ